MKTEEKMTATQARLWATKISAECSECFSSVKAVREFGRWVVKIDGGSGACYGRTVKSEDGAADLVRIFAN